MKNDSKRSKRIWLIVISFMVIVTAFSACAGTQDNAASQNDASASDTGSTEEKVKPEYSDFEELEGKKIGVVPVYSPLVEEQIPTAELLIFGSSSDMNQALQSHKIEAYTEDENIIRIMSQYNDSITWMPEYLDVVNISCAFPKNEEGEVLHGQVNEFVRSLREDGTLDEMIKVWTGKDEELKIPPDIEGLSAVNGTIHLAVDSQSMPLVYIKDNRYAGFEIDLMTRFCKEYGYALDIDDMTFSAVLAAIQSGKYDAGAASLTITEERAKTVLFADPYFETGVVLVVRTTGAESAGGFFEAVANSFKKTFIDEQRYMLFIQGILVTLLISVLSIFFGTALGFGLYLMCRKGNRIANAVTKAVVWLVGGMPVLILLMVLYYIIFGNVDISGIIVSVIGFTIAFGATVYGIIVSGVKAVDMGQTEGAYTLGLTDRQTFFGIILPQALPHMIPSYKGEIGSLIKGTSIVGYIAVMDLTKIGDIIRSRTYEAFFPIIAVAILYFVLAAIIRFLITKILNRINPRTRSSEGILKGVKTHD